MRRELDRRPFRPAWWLPGAHLQTVWSSLMRRPSAPAAALERWPTPDGDRLRLWIRREGHQAPWVILAPIQWGTYIQYFKYGCVLLIEETQT